MSDPRDLQGFTRDDGCAEDEAIALSASPELCEIIERSRESYRRHGGISAAEMRRQVRQWEAEEPTQEHGE